MSFAVKIEEVIKTQGLYMGTTSGVSMYPMLRNRRDTIVITPYTGRLKKYDVPLYKRGEKYVLHRILEVLPDSYVIRGDNCLQKEYGITDQDIIGVLSAFYRGDKKVDMDGWAYKTYVFIWCHTFLLRMFCKKLYGKLRSFYRNIKKKDAGNE